MRTKNYLGKWQFDFQAIGSAEDDNKPLTIVKMKNTELRIFQKNPNLKNTYFVEYELKEDGFKIGSGIGVNDTNDNKLILRQDFSSSPNFDGAVFHLTPEKDTRLKIIGDASDFNTNMVWVLKGEAIKKK